MVKVGDGGEFRSTLCLGVKATTKIFFFTFSRMESLEHLKIHSLVKEFAWNLKSSTVLACWSKKLVFGVFKNRGKLWSTTKILPIRSYFKIATASAIHRMFLHKSFQTSEAWLLLIILCVLTFSICLRM